MTRSASSQQAAQSTIEQALQQAIAHHQAGRLPDAERLYRAILQAHPAHPDAHHNLGVIAVQSQQPVAALPHFKAALEANPNQGQFWLSCIDALIQTGQSAAAGQLLEQGLQHGLRGDAVEALAGRLVNARQATESSNLEPRHTSKEAPPASQDSSRNRRNNPKTKSNQAAGNSAARFGKNPSAHEINTLTELFRTGRYADAEIRARAMTERFPRHGFSWKVLGATLQQLGRLEEALAAKRKAVEILPDDAEAHSNLGNALQEQGRFAEAEASLRRALEIQPGHVNALNNLGLALQKQGRFIEAETSLRRALEIQPHNANALYNLGIVLQKLERFPEAEASLRRAMEIKPDYLDAYNDLAFLLFSRGVPQAAMKLITRSLEIEKTAENKAIFVACIKRLPLGDCDVAVRDALVRALTESWGRPSELAPSCTILLKLNPEIGNCVTRAADAWPARLSAQDLFGTNGLAIFAGNPLLRALLDAAPICDIELERFLTMARRAMLETASAMAVSDSEIDAELGFHSALARQCFINEYVFFCTPDEIRKASDLRDSLLAALDAGIHVPALWLATVAAYFPLYTLPRAARLLERQWSEEVLAVLVQQVREPEEEQQLRASLPRLTGIEDEVSLLVQNQYEENPYPRWVKIPSFDRPMTPDRYLRRIFPLAPLKPLDKPDALDILIAGCGTGQQSIGTAQRFQGARVLAIDLSASSLGYAKRKTREMGLTSIEYAQADLLKLASLDRSFDVIESCGVLHHLADPWAGWRVLLSLLRPGGLMKLGFYSEVARRNIVRIRTFIAENGYGSTPDEIRRCRQDLVDLNESAGFGSTLISTDFFSISACRDLLFHVQEHRMTLTGINAFLRENNLAFLGFEIDADILHAYKRRFPEDLAATNLEQWQAFENNNPDAFIGMYQFWVQKADCAN